MFSPGRAEPSATADCYYDYSRFRPLSNPKDQGCILYYYDILRNVSERQFFNISFDM